MAMVEQLYQWLEAGPAPGCDRVLSAALEHAEPPYAARIHQILATRGNPVSWAALAGDYERVCPELQQQLTTDGDRLRLAIAEAVRLPTETARLGALAVLAQHPTPHSTVALSDALRDNSRAVCEAAARLLEHIVADFVDQHGSVPGSNRAAPAHIQLARQQVIRALTEALRSFETHWRVEPIQAALWYARELGNELWIILNKPRTRLREIIQERLPKWDGPRMAGFLLTALRDPAWAAAAEGLLVQWSQPVEIAALLQHSDLLNDPEYRARLADLKHPAWFHDIDRYILQLPPGLRVMVPRWVCAVGMKESERTAFLSRWLHKGCPLLRRASVYALADLNLPETPRRLEEIAAGNDAAATFARWWLCDREHRARHRPAPSDAQASTCAPVQLAEREESAEFALMWRVVRCAPTKQTGILLEALRINIDAWSNHVVGKLRSEDPRDRLLALRTLATNEYAPRFKRELQALLHDQVVVIRELARTLMQSVARLEAEVGLPLNMTGKPPSTKTHVTSTRSVTEVRQELLRFLNELLETDATDGYAADTLHELRAMLQEFHAARGMRQRPPVHAEVMP
ncbi:MAG: hypothetical protein JXO22_05040 [Phycisphaerae bacterium]|nr:hypothetical protein [Phycisphaerae bacterium]